MNQLIKYEFLKILRRRSTLIVMAVSLFITIVFFGLPIIQFQTYNENGALEGIQGIQYEKEQYAKISVPLTNQYITKTIREVQELFQDPDNIGYDGYKQFLIDDAYWNGIAPREKLLNMIAANYANPNESASYQALTELNVSDETDFYQTRQDKIKKIVNDSSKGLSEEEKEYWENLNGRVKGIFQYGYYGGWEVIISAFELLLFAILAVCIVAAPIFSGEYQAGTDMVILSARYGKTQLPMAKILAGVLFGVAAFTIHVAVAFGITIAAFGIDGWNLPLQINGTAVPYPFTFLQGILVNLCVIYLVLIAMISLTLFLSSKMKNPYLVLIIVVPVLFIPMFLSPNGTSGIYNLLIFLTPYQSLIPRFGSYISYQFGPLVFDVFSMRIIMCLAAVLILLPLAKIGFQHHQAV